MFILYYLYSNITQHEFELDSEALEVCRNEDIDCVVLYLGMNTVM